MHTSRTAQYLSAARRRLEQGRAAVTGRPHSWVLPLLGFFSLLWFLLRVVPKPSRAAYPCQRAAFPIASGFVVWVLGLATSFVVFRRAGRRLRRARYASAALSLAGAALVLVGGVILAPTPLATTDEAPFVPHEEVNQPMGTPRGMHPGRVVWVHNPDATGWDGNTGYWWEEGNTVQAEVSDMMSQALQTLTGAATDQAAWQALFSDFNASRGRGETGYQSGEKIAVKLNLNQGGSYRDPG